ncbi:MAG: MarR family transcriptional regulator [Patescibacteria group bacterium]
MEINSGQMCEDLMALLGRFKAAMHEIAEEHHLTPIQIGALYAILHGETTMGRVASTLHCDASNVTGIIDRLVAQQLVMRQESERDRRAKLLQLTPKGQQMMDEIIARLPEVVGCTKLNSTERETMHAIITKLTNA